jgi:hypothetical protein
VRKYEDCPDTAAEILADQVASILTAAPFYEIAGITRGLAAAFSAQAAKPDDDSAALFACWDAAFDVVEYRLPGTRHYIERGSYVPSPGQPSRDAMDTALARLAAATLAMPLRDDRRRALVVLTVLLATRPMQAQAAAVRLLSANIGSGPLTWVLVVLRDGIDGDISPDLARVLTDLAQSDWLSVRALAGEILTSSGRPAPAPPATEPELAMTRALADDMEGRRQ